MTRHQRRKRAKALALVRERKAIVRRNLSTPSALETSKGLVSGVYGNNMDRARGTGVVPMTRPTNGYRVIRREGRWSDCLK